MREYETKTVPQDHSVAARTDEHVIAAMAPELAEMSFVNGVTHVLDELDKFRHIATREQVAEFVRRVTDYQQAWQEDEGHEMPLGGYLVVLRTLQAETAAHSAQPRVNLQANPHKPD